MALGGCLTCVKYLLFIFNFFFWLAGCVLLSIGIWQVVDQKSFGDVDFLKGIGSYGGYGLITIGSIIMVVGFFGCCGAIRESQCLLITFFICLFIIFGVMLGIGIYYAVNKEGSEDLIRQGYVKIANEYSDTTKPLAKEEVDNIHRDFKCCGHTAGILDFKGSTPAGCNPITDGTAAVTSCPKAITEKLASQAIIVAGVALGIGVVLLLGMIFSLMLCCAIRDSV